MLQIPPLEGEAENSARFAVRVQGDSMQAVGGDDFRPGEVLVFSSGFEVKSGDFACVLLRDSALFRRVEFDSGDMVRLIPLNPNYQTRTVPRGEIRRMFKLVRHLRGY